MDAWLVALIFLSLEFGGWLYDNGPWCRVTTSQAYQIVPGRVLTPEEMERLREDWARSNRGPR